ncbi:MAG TPA: FAD binding domain-containing protein [Chloroflexota bacterium]|nr:FAD binding domain-containing protein [Chloroflexota bacterium]
MRELREYLRPESIEEAVAIKRERGCDAVYLAGGTDVLVLKPRGVTTVIDIMAVDAAGVHQDGEAIVIGATALLCDIEQHPAVRTAVGGALRQAIRETGPWLIRNAATLAGNVCNASPSADSAAMLLTLDAELTLSDGAVVSLDRFFVGPHETVLTDELVKEIRLFPRGRLARFHKHARSKSDIALVNLAVSARAKDGALHDVRIALGSVAPTPIRARETERLLEGREIDAAVLRDVEASVRREIRPISDWRTSAEYRAHSAGLLVRRAVEGLLSDLERRSAEEGMDS